MKFRNLQFEEVSDGIATRHTFPNGFGCQIEKTNTSMGGDQGYYEITLLNQNGDIVEDSFFHRGKIGYLTKCDVEICLKKIQEMKS